jgi:hypothetical protein
MIKLYRNGAAQRAALAGLAVALCGCATGQGSFIAGAGGNPNFATDIVEGDGSSFSDVAPGLLAAGGNALLPGSRTAASAALLGSQPAANLSTASLTTSGLLGGPLLGLNGRQNLLLSLPVGANVLGRSGGGAVTVVAGMSPGTASTSLLVSLTAIDPVNAVQVGVTTPVLGGGATTAPVTPPVTVPPVTTPITGPVTLPPISPPTLAVSGVPGTVPITTLISRLTGH